MRFNQQTGPKPSKAVLSMASKYARQDTGDYMAIAMSMRPNGVTQNEIIALLGRPHRNKIKSLLETKQVKRLVLADGSRSTRIKLVKS